MKFMDCRLGDAMLIETDQVNNVNNGGGYFTRIIDRSELTAHGLVGEFVRSNYYYSRRRGALRGIHYQQPPFAGPQLLRCIRGAIFAVIVDLRANLPNTSGWEGFNLTERNGRLLYIPVGFALGFQTVDKDTEVIHQLAHPLFAETATGLRYDDPALAICWPEPLTEISPRDASWPLLAAPPPGSLSVHGRAA